MLLKADTEAGSRAWIGTLTAAIERALAGGEAAEEDASRVMTELQTAPGNTACCDCTEANPEWASINLGVLMCLECSGVHRSLGVHLTKVQSLRLDVKKWTPSLLRGMKALGNAKVEAAWLAAARDAPPQPSPDSERAEKEAYIRAKYEDLDWWHAAGFAAPDAEL